MSKWSESEWRSPRNGEIVRDLDGNLGRVTKSEGLFSKRLLWVEDLNGIEVYSGKEADFFNIVDLDTSRIYQLERHKRLGLYVGAVVKFTKRKDIPLLILQMEWENLRGKIVVCMKSLLEFEGEVMRTSDLTLISVLDENFPPIESIFSSHDSGLKYRLDVNLIEKATPSWTNCGSPWEFQSQEDAIKEVEAWKSRLKIRRVASVLNADWIPHCPCWTIDATRIGEKVFTRVKPAETFEGSPGYFKTSYHAAIALTMIAPIDWERALFSSHDTLNL